MDQQPWPRSMPARLVSRHAIYESTSKLKASEFPHGHSPCPTSHMLTRVSRKYIRRHTCCSPTKASTISSCPSVYGSLFKYLRGGKIKFRTFVLRGTLSPYTVSVNAKLFPLTRGSGVLTLVLVTKLTFG